MFLFVVLDVMNCPLSLTPKQNRTTESRINQKGNPTFSNSQLGENPGTVTPVREVRENGKPDGFKGCCGHFWYYFGRLVISVIILKFVVIHGVANLKIENDFSCMAPRGNFPQTDWRGILAVFQQTKIKGEVWQTSPSANGDVSKQNFTPPWTRNKLTLTNPKAFKSPRDPSFRGKQKTTKNNQLKARHGVALLAVWNAGLIGRAGFK